MTALESVFVIEGGRNAPARPTIREAAFAEIGRCVSLSATGQSTIAVVEAGRICRPADLRRTASRVLTQASSGDTGDTGEPRWVGAACAPADGRSSLARTKAMTAVRLGRVIWPAGGAILYDDVWLLELLGRDQTALGEIASVLEPILCGDVDGADDLLTTLETFVDHDLSQARTARRLGVHRHTVAQRIEAAERLLGRSLRVGRERTLLELAIKARRLVAASPEARSIRD